MDPRNALMLQALPTICLVACVRKKRTTPGPAKDFYTSPWFVKARNFAEARASRWFILSAKYGLVDPDQILFPYNLTLNVMSISERRAWAEDVKEQMDRSMPQASRIIVLAGQRYRESLMDYLRTRAPSVEVPMRGLGIGKQLRYLTDALHERV